MTIFRIVTQDAEGEVRKLRVDTTDGFNSEASIRDLLELAVSRGKIQRYTMVEENFEVISLQKLVFVLELNK